MDVSEPDASGDQLTETIQIIHNICPSYFTLVTLTFDLYFTGNPHHNGCQTSPTVSINGYEPDGSLDQPTETIHIIHDISP